MKAEGSKDFLDRLAMVFFGAFSGGAYGLVLALLSAWLFSSWHSELTLYMAAVFGVMGFFFENVVYESVTILWSFIYGFLFVLLSRRNWRGFWDLFVADLRPPPKEFKQPTYIRSIVLFGFGTGLAFALWYTLG